MFNLKVKKMKRIFKLFSAFFVIGLVSMGITSCRGTYPASFVHADAINFGDNVNANFNTKTYEGKPFNLYVEKEVAKDAASAFNQRKKQNDGANVFAELEKEIKSAVPQNNTAGIYAMDVALRRVKHMQKEYNKDINVKYTLVYITDGLDNISVQAAKNNFKFPKKKNYKTPDNYKKKMSKRIKRISRYKKDIKNQFDIYPMVFTGSDLGLVEGEIILGKLKDICAKEKIDIKKLNKRDIAYALKRKDSGYESLSEVKKIHRWAQDSVKLDIPENYIAKALEESKDPFNEFINNNMKWMRGSSRGMKDNECPQIIYSNDFDKIKKNFETEFATSSFEFQVPKGYVKQDVKMTMYDADNNIVDIQGTLKKTMFGKYYLKDVKGSENFDFIGADKKIKAINKSKKDPLAKFVVTKPQLVEGERKPFIVINDKIEQSYRSNENSFWVENSEYDSQTSAEVKTYILLIYDCSKSLEEEIYTEQKTLIDIANIVRESSKIDKVLE